MMKILDDKIYLTLSFLFVFLITGCSLDSYDSPSSTLSGQVVYQGEPVGVASGQVELELWESGFELREKIPVNVKPDGSFSALLYDGDYKLTLLPDSGPWVVKTDSIDIQLRGEATIDVPVEPYYVINNETVTHSNGNIEATFDVDEINNSRFVEFIGLYVSTTSIVDEQNNTEREILDINENGSLSGQSLTVVLPSNLLDRDFIFARIGVKITGVSNMLFSQTLEISL